MPNFNDLTGKRFGRLLVVSFSHMKNGSNWNCVCDCGQDRTINVSGLTRKSKPTRSCGCLAKEAAASAIAEKGTNYKHGHAANGRRSRALSIWSGMHDRCNRPNNHAYQYYGGRGIFVCERWKDFHSFLSDMGEPGVGMSIDRIDVNGPYSPENCRWANSDVQANNTRSNRKFLFNGELKTIAQIAREIGVPAGTLYSRFNRGLSVNEAVSFGRTNARMDKINGRRD